MKEQIVTSFRAASRRRVFSGGHTGSVKITCPVCRWHEPNKEHPSF
jgi:hypothetical protein